MILPLLGVLSAVLRPSIYVPEPPELSPFQVLAGETISFVGDLSNLVSSDVETSTVSVDFSSVDTDYFDFSLEVGHSYFLSSVTCKDSDYTSSDPIASVTFLDVENVDLYYWDYSTLYMDYSAWGVSNYLVVNDTCVPRVFSYWTYVSTSTTLRTYTALSDLDWVYDSTEYCNKAEFASNIASRVCLNVANLKTYAVDMFNRVHGYNFYNAYLDGYANGFDYGYRQGYQGGSDFYYENGRQTGYSDGYDHGYGVGYSVGYNEGVADQGTNAIASNIFGAVVSIPISILNGLSVFTIWSVPIVSILITFLVIGLVIWIIKKVI